MNTSPLSVYEGAPLSKAYSLFRHLGLRHMPVVDQENRTVGMLTRANLLFRTADMTSMRLYKREELHTDNQDVEFTPRMQGHAFIEGQSNRLGLPLVAGWGGQSGGKVRTWQSRLAGKLDY